MRLRICAIGRMKAGAERDLMDEYLKRARGPGRNVGLTAIDAADAPEAGHPEILIRKTREATLLRGLHAPGAVTVALDATGNTLSTEAFAAFLGGRIAAGTDDLAFLIGGPDGHAPETLARVSLVLSLGPMTWPHRLVRVMLAEQIYRVVTIMVNHPYHRS